MRQYFFYIDGKQEGPFSIEDLKEKKLQVDTPIWFKGLANWTTINEVEELKHLFDGTPPPYVTKSSIPPPISKVDMEDKVLEESKQKQTPKPLANLTKPKSNSGKTLLIIGCVIVLILIVVSLSKQIQQQDYKQNIETSKNFEEDTKARVKNNITSYIKANRSAYNYSGLGGISNLSITVTNSSDYLMDNVKIKISYLKPNGDVWDTKLIDFNLLEAHSKQTLRVEDTDRGTSVQYEIVSIHSTVLGL